MLYYYKPKFRSKYWAWIVSEILPAVVGYQRVRTEKHFPSDVIAGYLTGAAIGFLIPKIHESSDETTDLPQDFLIGVGTGILVQYIYKIIRQGKYKT